MGRRKQVYLTLGAVVRNQSHYVKEWLAFHYLMGVERFCIALHHCTDNTEAKIKELPFQKKIALFNVGGDAQHVQMGVYKKLHEMYGDSTKWMLFIDSDEFMFPLKHNNLVELLHGYEKKFSSLSVNQRMFGHANQVMRPEGLSIEKFIWATRAENDINDRAIKTIYQPQYFKAFYSPHFQLCHTLPQVRSDKNTFVVEAHCHTESLPIQDVVRYNHYYTRSMEDWIERCKRGSCNDGRISPISYNIDEFQLMGANHIINEDILKWAIPLRKLLNLPYSDIKPNNVKTVTWADGIHGEEIAKTAINSGKAKKIKVIPIIDNPVFFRGHIHTKLLRFHEYIRKEKAEYLLCVDGRDTLFLDDMKTICHKLQLMYDGRVLCCSQSFPHPYRDKTFSFMIGSKYSWRGYANPCAFFGTPADLDKLFTELVAIYHRLKTNKPKTQIEQFIIDTKAAEKQDLLSNVQFIWQVYQANGEHWDLHVDTDVRLFVNTGNLMSARLEERGKIVSKFADPVFLGSASIVHAPRDVEKSDFVTWAVQRGLLSDGSKRNDERVAVELDAADVRGTTRKQHPKKQNRRVRVPSKRSK